MQFQSLLIIDQIDRLGGIQKVREQKNLQQEQSRN